MFDVFFGDENPGAHERGAGGGTPRGTPEGFLFVATKRNPSDSKEKNAFGAMVTRGIVFTKQVVVSGLHP